MEEYSLTEQFALEERLVLTEDLADDAFAYVTKIKNDAGANFANVIAVLDKINDKTDAIANYQKIKEALDKLTEIRQKIDDADKRADGGLTEIITLITSPDGYLKSLQDLIDACKDNLEATKVPELQGHATALQNRCAKTPPSKHDILTKYNKINLFIDATDDTAREYIFHWDTIKGDAAGLSKFNTAITAAKDYISKNEPEKYLLDLDAIRGAEDKNIRSYRDTLIKLSTAVSNIIKMGARLKSHDIAERTKRLDAFNEATAEIIISPLIKFNKDKADFDDVVAKSQKADWATKYSEADSKEKVEAFWDEYYTTEWGELASVIKMLGNTFKQELRKIGWNTITNPFVKFLKDKSDYLDTIKADGHKITLFAAVYTVMHNAIAGGNLLELKDLKGEGTFKDYNIIFNTNWFELSSGKAQQYLEQQEQLETAGSRSALNSAAKAVYDRNPGEVLANIMYTAGNARTLNEPISVDAAMKAVFRTTSEVASIISLIAKEEALKSQITSAEIAKIINWIGTDKTKAKKVLAYLVVVWRSQYINAIENVNTAIKNKGGGVDQLYSNSDKNMPKWNEAGEYERILLAYNYTPKLAETLLTEIAKKAGYTLD